MDRKPQLLCWGLLANPSTERSLSTVLFRLSAARSCFFRNSSLTDFSFPDSSIRNQALRVLLHVTIVLSRRLRWYLVNDQSEHPEFHGRHSRDTSQRSDCQRFYRCIIRFTALQEKVGGCDDQEGNRRCSLHPSPPHRYRQIDGTLFR